MPDTHVNRIQILPPHVAERIAAGEVIERPSSVVKELVENSIDAMATEIVITLEDGGKTKIEIIDNGLGMSAADLELCTSRHATSKVKTLADLESLSSLGFRGEALPSIAAVAELRLTSRPKFDSSAPSAQSLPAHQLILGNLQPQRLSKAPPSHFLGCSHGTRIEVIGLFSQVPARLKFLKSSGAELSAVREWIERLALAYPEVGFKLISATQTQTRTVFQVRPHSSELERVKAILLDGEEYPTLTHTLALPGIQVRAYWLQGMSIGHMRKIIQIVNRRAVKDRMLNQAALTAFRQALLPGQFPAVCMYLEADPAQIDVNVHPTKTEIRLLESNKVFRAIEETFSTLIRSHGAIKQVQAVAQSNATFSAPEQAQFFTRPSFSKPSYGSNSTVTQTAQDQTSSAFSFNNPTTLEQTSPPSTTSPPALVGPFDFLKTGRFLGSLFQTYFIYDLGNEAVLIDQHAAHERIRFEKLKQSRLNPSSIQTQQLLIPEVATSELAAEADEKNFTSPMLELLLNLLKQYGFDVELFGAKKLLFRGLPNHFNASFDAQLKVRLQNLINRIELVLNETDISTALKELDFSKLMLNEKLFEALASEACHSAVRAHDKIDPSTVHSLVAELSQCEHPWNCPHGRPVMVKIPASRFEEWFLRKAPSRTL